MEPCVALDGSVIVFLVETDHSGVNCYICGHAENPIFAHWTA